MEVFGAGKGAERVYPPSLILKKGLTLCAILYKL